MIDKRIVKRIWGGVILVGFIWLLGWIIQIDARLQKTDLVEPDQVVTTQKITINFEFDSNNSISVEYPYDSQDLLAITQNIVASNDWAFVSQNYGELGTLITQIGDKTNGDNGQYWQYYVDDIQPMLAVNDYQPPVGSQIDWRFQESEF